MKFVLRLFEFLFFQATWKGIEKMLSTTTLKFISDNLLYWFYILGALSLTVYMICSYKKYPFKRFAFAITEIITLKIFPNKGKRANLSLEIDHNIKLLHEFWEKIGVSSAKEPISITQALNKAKRIVSKKPTAKIFHTIRKDYYLTEPPRWHCKEVDKPTSLDALPEKEQQGVRQFYDKLDAIILIYKKLRTSKESSIIEELENEIETLIVEVLNQGNPLKTT
jgi:hypothetical protein